MIPIKIIICDDHSMFRRGLKVLLEDLDGMHVIGEADNGKQLLALLENLQPDIILLDLEMPVMDGIETLNAVHELYPHISIIILTMHSEESIRKHMIELGAHGLLLKNDSLEKIESTIRNVVLYGDIETSEIVLEKNNRKKHTHKKSKFYFGAIELSDREVEIIRHICNECSNKEIAQNLNISIKTVETHRENISKKLNVRNIAGIVRFAVKNGIVYF